MGRDYILSVIREYAFEMWAAPRNPLSKEDFKLRSYRQWAFDEIAKKLKIESYEPPIVVLEDFADTMRHYSCKNEKTSDIFSTAYQAALDILDVLNAMV